MATNPTQNTVRNRREAFATRRQDALTNEQIIKLKRSMNKYETQIGDFYYDLKNDVIGHGSFGTVFVARNFEKDTKAAIKVINVRGSQYRRMPAEMKDRELTILTDISSTPHPNLIQLLHYERSESEVCLVMEYCNGKDLRNYLQEQKRLSESVIRLFFRQIAKGMKFLHDKGIIHRDLKPENILLNYDGKVCPKPEDITLKIADFGLGIYLPTGDFANTLVGTSEYKAPEILPGNPYDHKVDVWSTGVMMRECLVGMENARLNFKIGLPSNSTEDLREILTEKLLVRQPSRRIDFDEFLNHSFMTHDESRVLIVQNGSSSLATTGTDKDTTPEQTATNGETVPPTPPGHERSSTVVKSGFAADDKSKSQGKPPMSKSKSEQGTRQTKM